MARTSRIKRKHGIYHIMVKSIPELKLYNDNEDKDKYLKIIKEKQVLFGFKIYAFCIMSNHGHFIIDSNGSDISEIMQSINSKYAFYFNMKYKRNGHLFLDRFKSKLIKDDRYLYLLSLYIHSNPKDIVKYRNTLESYYYSSLSNYFYGRRDKYNIVDTSRILFLFSNNIKSPRKNYKLAMENYNKMKQQEFNFKNDINKEAIELKNNKSKDRDLKHSIDKITTYLSKKFMVDKSLMNLKYNNEVNIVKSFLFLFMRCFCKMKVREIYNIYNNHSINTIYKLSNSGVNLMLKNPNYKYIMAEYLSVI
ncbi:transposase [Clostridium sp. 'White wine YQ']|uniref:transposase n=1 Tax=Clostridium sp. 'White wine YQ' TaxID=3027474 RepID=UPI0023665229|nr:transposase [Clostridium sp. 'White wine YQ']MDD7794575.1 transposase [Clostridium sp. 'White wine YQ']